jgi:hypothetical protein
LGIYAGRHSRDVTFDTVAIVRLLRRPDKGIEEVPRPKAMQGRQQI